MRKKYAAILLIIVLCLSIILSACTTAGVNKSENTKTVEADKMEQEEPPPTEKKQEGSVDSADDKETDETVEQTTEETEETAEQTAESTAEESAGETAKEENTADTENQGVTKTTSTSEQQSLAQQNVTRQNTTQQNTVQQNTVQQNTGQKSSNTNTAVSANTGNKTTNNVQSLVPETVKKELLQHINNTRTRAGVPALVWSDILVQEAGKMLENRSYSVDSKRLSSLGLSCKNTYSVRFDIDASITPDTNSIFNYFLNLSEGIFSSDYWYIGIATKSLPNKSLGVAIVCADSFTVSEEIKIREDLEQRVFEQINRIRKAAGANPLKWNEVAAQKARDSMKKQREGIYDNQVNTYSRFYSLEDLPKEVEEAMKSYQELVAKPNDPSMTFAGYPFISDNSYTQVGIGACQKVKIETKNGKSETTESEYFIGYIFLED